MKRTMILATAISLVGSFGANGQSLRAMRAPAGAMPAFEAVTITRSMGLDPLGGPVWENGSYVLRATDEDGREMRVVLDGHDGRVLAVRPMARRYFAPIAPGYGPRNQHIPEYDFVRGREFDHDLSYAFGEPHMGVPPAAAHRNRARGTVASTATGDEVGRRTAGPVQSAKQQPSASPPLPVKKPEAAPQSVRPDRTITASSDQPKTMVRKIDIHKTPADTSISGTTNAPSAESPEKARADDGNTSTFGFPINPLL
jgi:hypothetical protein